MEFPWCGYAIRTDEQIRDLLTNSRLWFVVGLGDNPGRLASNGRVVNEW